MSIFTINKKESGKAFSDTERLDWLLKKLAQSELRDIGLDVSRDDDNYKIKRLIDAKLNLSVYI